MPAVSTKSCDALNLSRQLYQLNHKQDLFDCGSVSQNLKIAWILARNAAASPQVENRSKKLPSDCLCWRGLGKPQVAFRLSENVIQ